MTTPIRPNLGVQSAYECKLCALVDAQAASYQRFAIAAARPLLATDASPFERLRWVFDDLAERWLLKFDEAAPKLADYFASTVGKRVDTSLATILRDGGYSVRFKPTAAQQLTARAVAAEQATLIKSVGEQYRTNVEGAILRSVSAGGDLQALSHDLQTTAGVSRRRAVFIAEQSNWAATALMTRTRQLETGIRKAKWRHSRGQHVPRPTHVAFDKHEYDVETGVVLDPKEGVVWPGTAIRCHCLSIPKIAGFDLPGDK